MAVMARPAAHLQHRGARLLLVGLLALGLASIAGALIFAWPHVRSVKTHFELGSVDKYDVGSVAQVAAGKFYLVRLTDKEFVALSWREPGHGCTVPWRPTFAWPDPENGGALRTGWFRDPCGGSTFDRDGTRVFGPAPRNMDRYAVSVVGGQVSVDTSQYVCGFAPPGARCAGQDFAPEIAPLR